MKKWLQFFTFSFFSHKTSKEAAHRGYTNLFLGLLLSFAFLWGFLIALLLPPMAGPIDTLGRSLPPGLIAGGFAAFLAGDLYGFISWRKMEKRQQKTP